MLSFDSLLASARRRVLWIVALLALLLAAPSMFADLYTDDQGMVLAMDGVAPPMIPGPFRLYTFMTGKPGERDGHLAVAGVTAPPHAAFGDSSRLVSSRLVHPERPS